MRVGLSKARFLFARAALLACALACASAAGARQLPEARAQLDEDNRWVNGVTESWWLDDNITKEDATGAAALWKAIGDEVAGAKGEAWAGDYFRGGETHGTYLRWSPRGGFVIADVDKCRAAVMGLTYGRVEATPALVQFFPEVDKRTARPHHGGGGQHAAAPPPAPRAVLRFVPVEWRGERLLVAEEEMGDFGDYVSGRGTFNDWHNLLEYAAFFSRSGAGETAADPAAPPAVPPGYERFLKEPIEAAVTAVGRRVLRRDYIVETEHTSATYARASLTYVNISAGTAHGVKDRMLFRAARPGPGEMVIVVRARRRTSTAVVVRDVDGRGRETYFDHDESRDKRLPKLAAGLRLTTSLF